jgi:carbon monoxide dehydrogenase subunit G
MKLEQSFEVQAPLDEVWAALVDVERVAPCLPGAAVTGRNDDGTYNGTFTIKIGPTTASYTGKLEMQDIDESSHSATMHAQGSDKRGQGGATATISSKLSSSDGQTRVEVVTDYHITGRLARFGRGGMIEDISERLLREFASRLQASLTYSGSGGGPAAENPDGPVGEEDGSEQPTSETASLTETEGPMPTETVSEPPMEKLSPAPMEPAPPLTEAAAPPPTEAAGPPPTEADGPPPTEAAGPPAPEPEAAPPPPAPEAGPPPPPPPPHGEPPPPPPPPHAAPPPPPPPPASENEPVQGLALVGSVMFERVKRNPAPLIGVIGGLLVLRLVLRRR